MQRFAALLLSLLQMSRLAMHTAGQEDIDGSSDCPCIDPWATAAPGDARTCREVAINRGRHLGSGNASTACVPLDYGSRCAAWDNASHASECQTPSGAIPESGVPGWCGSRWCYVDPARCWRPTDPSDMVASAEDVAEASCTGVAEAIETACDGTGGNSGETCDLDPATDSMASCPAGCSATLFTPICDLDATTDGTAACPEGCTVTAHSLVYSYETCGNKNS
jgi:hypothetical protein